MRLRLGGSSLTFKSEKIRLNSKLSVKIVRKQVYERTESSFACCGFFWRYDFTFARTWMVDWWGSSFTVFLFMLSLWFAPCLISFHPSAPLGALLSIETKQSNEKPNWQGLLRCISALTASEMLAMEQPLLCFHPCQNKNTTQNPLAHPTFHRLPKNRFFIRRICDRNRICGGKSKYRPPMRLRLGSSSLMFKSDKIRWIQSFRLRLCESTFTKGRNLLLLVADFFGFCAFLFARTWRVER